MILWGPFTNLNQRNEFIQLQMLNMYRIHEQPCTYVVVYVYYILFLSLSTYTSWALISDSIHLSKTWQKLEKNWSTLAGIRLGRVKRPRPQTFRDTEDPDSPDQPKDGTVTGMDIAQCTPRYYTMGGFEQLRFWPLSKTVTESTRAMETKQCVELAMKIQYEITVTKLIVHMKHASPVYFVLNSMFHLAWGWTEKASQPWLFGDSRASCSKS